MKWEDEIKRALRTLQDLCEHGYLDKVALDQLRPVAHAFRVFIPQYYASLIDKKDPLCPIRLQAVPAVEELQEFTMASPDPLMDLDHQKAPHITHRYPDRVLLHLTTACPMMCRHCFRKSLLNAAATDFIGGYLHEGLQYIFEHKEIQEVIFSGGDPWMVKDEVLKNLLGQLSKIPHIQRLRFHTRCPVTLPSRVTPDLIKTLTSSRFQPVVVTHFNHPREWTPESASACRFLVEAGISVLNQSVLMRRVNDSAPTLTKLWKILRDGGVRNYYLHHPDRAQGTGHFWLEPEHGLAIYSEARKMTPGHLLPRYVIDIPEMGYKADVGEYLYRRNLDKSPGFFAGSTGDVSEVTSSDDFAGAGVRSI